MPQLRLFPFESGRQAHRKRMEALDKLEEMGLIDFVKTELGNTKLKTESVYIIRIYGIDGGNPIELSLGAREVLAFGQGMLAALARSYTDDNRLAPVVKHGWLDSVVWYLGKLPETDARFAVPRACTANDDPDRTQPCTACSHAGSSGALERCKRVYDDPDPQKDKAMRALVREARNFGFHGCVPCCVEFMTWKAERREAVTHIAELHKLLDPDERATLAQYQPVLAQALAEYVPGPVIV